MVPCYLQQLSISWRYCMLRRPQHPASLLTHIRHESQMADFNIFCICLSLSTLQQLFWICSWWNQHRSPLGLALIPSPSSPTARKCREAPSRALSIFFFKCCHKYSIGLRSGDCIYHSRILIPLVSSHLRAIREVCFGSLSCWEVLSLMSSS